VLARNYVALERLNTLSVTFNNSKVHSYGVTGLEFINVFQRLSLDQRCGIHVKYLSSRKDAQRRRCVSSQKLNSITGIAPAATPITPYFRQHSAASN
tara:strand:- start:3024 stop:3314 length:291 start_codon:yes stop_codon:yes gene_type:complete